MPPPPKKRCQNIQKSKDDVYGKVEFISHNNPPIPRPAPVVPLIKKKLILSLAACTPNSDLSSAFSKTVTDSSAFSVSVSDDVLSGAVGRASWLEQHSIKNIFNLLF